MKIGNKNREQKIGNENREQKGTSPQIYTVTILRAPNAKTHVYDDLLLLIFQSDPSNDEMIVGQA